jgi:hypothetical protein
MAVERNVPNITMVRPEQVSQPESGTTDSDLMDQGQVQIWVFFKNPL